MKSVTVVSGVTFLGAALGVAVGTQALDPSPVLAPRATPTVWGVQRPSERPVMSDPRVQGCFSSGGDLVYVDSLQFNARDSCPRDICMKKLNKNVGGTIRGSECWCGDKYPPKSSLVDDKECNIGCTGYGQEACGGEFTFTIYNTGNKLYGIDFMPEEQANNTTPSTTPSPSQSTAAVETDAQKNNSKEGGGGGNTAGIAAGVVVGVLVLGALAGGGWFFYRKRRNAALEEEHRRNAAVNAFIHGNKASSSRSVSLADSRMDPQMAQRRMSDGSIADNQDYSRRILRVTNA